MDVIVTRHRAAVEFIASRIVVGQWRIGDGCVEVLEEDTGAISYTIPVLASAEERDVLGNEVYGNLPLHLACVCKRYFAVEFDGAPPRGKELTLKDMEAAGARLEEYHVYRARDAWNYHCDKCGYSEASPDGAHCQYCGY